MGKGLSRFKPGVTRHTHLFMSAFLWTAIGMLLLIKGALRVESLSLLQAFVVAMALLAGSLKSYFILDKSARRGINRILNFNDNTCLGAVYSGKSWILVLCMMGVGVILRNSSLSVNLLCFLYITIGWALLLSSRLAWRVWLTRK